MISCEDKKRLQELINQAFPKFDEKERERMVEDLVNQEGAYTVFCEFFGDHISKVGVKYRSNNETRGAKYYVTEYYSEMLDS